MAIDHVSDIPQPISNETFRKIVTEVADGIIGIDASGIIRFANPAAEQIFGWDHNGLIGKPLTVLLPDRVRAFHEGLVASFRVGHVEARRMGQRGSGIVGRRNDGTEINLGITILKTDSDGEPLMIAVVRDITEHVLQSTELKRLADTDPLTGLLNRRAFFERATSPTSVVGASIILMDLDHFKQINDQFGHDAGDRVIQFFAGILRQSARRLDLAARLGGEEFVLLTANMTVDQATPVAQAIRRQTLEQVSVQFQPLPLSVTVSAGVAEIREGDISDALKRADAALYEAKRAGRDRVVSSPA